MQNNLKNERNCLSLEDSAIAEDKTLLKDGDLLVGSISNQWYATEQSEHTCTPLYICWKKAMDLLFERCGLLVLCAILAIIAPLIYLDSPGPIFHSQERVGLRRKPFRIYKSRSMCPNAETEDDAAIKLQYDICYIKHWSLTLDLFLLSKTVVQVCSVRST